MALRIYSPAFENQSMMDERYTCEGENISPILMWDGIPQGAKSLVMIADDPDAPDPENPKKTWVHWVLYNLPPVATTLEDGVLKQNLPDGTLCGVNDRQFDGYSGPCPPIGVHRYYFKLFAIDIVLPDLGAVTKAQIMELIRGHQIESTQMYGVYIRKENRR